MLTPAQMKLKIQDQLTKEQEKTQIKSSKAQEVKREYHHMHLRDDNRAGLLNQIKEHEKERKVKEQAELEIGMRESMVAEMKYKNECEQEKQRQKDAQLLYKKQLDDQMNLRRKFNMYGNMSGVEKNLNRNELLAYKNFDYKYNSMIPGQNSSPHQPSQKILMDKMMQS